MLGPSSLSGAETLFLVMLVLSIPAVLAAAAHASYRMRDTLKWRPGYSHDGNHLSRWLVPLLLVVLWFQAAKLALRWIDTRGVGWTAVVFAMTMPLRGASDLASVDSNFALIPRRRRSVTPKLGVLGGVSGGVTYVIVLVLSQQHDCNQG